MMYDDGDGGGGGGGGVSYKCRSDNVVVGQPVAVGTLQLC